MEIEFVPACMSGVGEGAATIKGKVMVSVPMFPERLRLQAEFGAKFGDADLDKFQKMELVAALAERVKPMVSSVEVSTVDDLHSAKSADELYSNAAFDVLVSEIAVGALRGFAGN